MQLQAIYFIDISVMAGDFLIVLINSSTRVGMTIHLIIRQLSIILKHEQTLTKAD